MSISSLDGEIFARLLETCGDAVFVADQEGRYLGANQAALELVGYDLAELTRMTMAELTAPEDRSQLPSRVQGLRESGKILVERELLHRDGSRVPVEIGATALPDGRLVGIVREIRLRREAERRADRLWQALATMLSVTEQLARPGPPDLQVICESLVRGQTYSLAWIGVADWQSGEVAVVAAAGPGEEYAREIVVRCDDSPEGNGPTGRCMKEGRRVLNNRLGQNPRFAPWKEKARHFGLQASSSFPISRGGKVWGALNVYAPTEGAFDAAEVTLLERLTAQLGSALTAAEDAEARRDLSHQLQRADRLATLGVVSASVGHEILGPLSHAITELATLEQTETSAPALDRLKESLQRVESLVRQLPGMARTTEPEIGAIPVSEVVASALAIAGPRLRARATVTDQVLPGVQVQADRLRLGQILLNLLLNAGQAIPASSDRDHEIRIGALREGPGWVKIWVEDTGPGISGELRERIFDPFFTTKSSEDGTGIGLAVSRQLAEQLGGSLTLAAAVGGARFELLLPGAATSVDPGALNPGLREPGIRHRILIIDDEVMLADALGGLLGLRHEVEVCYDARQGLVRCQEERFDLVLCDLIMPRMGGIAFYQALRARSDPHAERVVFTTGGVFDPEVETFLQQVDNTTLPKPVGLDAVEALLVG